MASEAMELNGDANRSDSREVSDFEHICRLKRAQTHPPMGRLCESLT